MRIGDILPTQRINMLKSSHLTYRPRTEFKDLEELWSVVMIDVEVKLSKSSSDSPTVLETTKK